MKELEQIVEFYGPVEVRYVPANEEDPWTVTMVETTRVWDGEKYIDWHDHEHGPSLTSTSKALLELLQKTRGPRRPNA